MSTEPNPGCALCRYFHEHSPGSGDCRRYPPVFVGGETSNERHRWRHPLVPAHNWCGEFQDLAER